MDENLILEALKIVHMSPQGIFTGLIGATLSLFVINGKEVTLKRIIFVLLAGFLICGYSIQVISHLPLLRSPAASSLANIVVGFLVSDFLSSLKSAAPSLTSSMIKKAADKIGANKERTNDE